MRSLLRIAFDADGRLELPVRAWASRGDPVPRASLDRIDRQRTTYVERLFEDLGFSASEAATRARLVYFALIGQFAGADPRFETPEDLDAFFRMLVSPPPG